MQRREFLKLLTASPLFYYGLSPISGNPAPLSQGGKKPNIFIVVFDTLSALHVSLYGYRRETMPNLARLAERSHVFHNHRSTAIFTTPGTASLLTGTYPWTHRALRINQTVAAPLVTRNLFSLFKQTGYYRIAYSHNPLVNIFLQQFDDELEAFPLMQSLYMNPNDFWTGNLLARDYDIAGISRHRALRLDNGWAGSLFLSKFFNWQQEKHIEQLKKAMGDLYPRGLPNVDETNFFLLEDAIDWIIVRLNSLPSPFLAYFHLMPPHSPYRARYDFVDRFLDDWFPKPKPFHTFTNGISDEVNANNRREYDEFVANVDSEFGRLYTYLESSGLLENTLLIFTSDHGEMFERGILGHIGETVHEPLLRVPLLISEPGQDQRNDVHTPTSSVDILPSLLQLTGQTIPDWLEGEILPPFRKDSPSEDRAFFALEAKTNAKYAPIAQATVAIIKGGYKLVHYFGYPKHEPFAELFDLQNDPDELEDLQDKGVRDALQEELQAKLDEVNAPYIG